MVFSSLISSLCADKRKHTTCQIIFARDIRAKAPCQTVGFGYLVYTSNVHLLGFYHCYLVNILSVVVTDGQSQNGWKS